MFTGSIPALVTPFKNGAVDREAFANLVERQISGGSGALVPVGTTGETSTLSHEEHKAVVTLCVEVAGGRIPVIAGAGSNSTSEAIELAAHAKTVGADAVLVVCPYYNKPNQEGLYAHFAAINDAVQVPVVVYNVPGRTVVDLSVETVGRLSKLPNIVAIKDATGDLARVPQHAMLAEGEQFIQLSGDDPTSLAHRVLGGQGCISVTANVLPEACAAVHAAYETGDIDHAREIETRLAAIHDIMFTSPSPGPAKYVLSKMGLCEPDVRLPITAPDEAACEAIHAAFKAGGFDL